MSRVLAAGAVALAALAGSESGRAADCPGNPQALGTSRVLSVSPAAQPRVGTWHYAETLDLADREVVLTFDDGPMRPHTAAILDILKRECVRATFLVVGAMAASSPQLLRRAFDEGHTIGTHTQSHPRLPELPEVKARGEIERAVAAAQAALGPSRPLAPFFRAPYLALTPALEAYLEARGLMVWDIDVHAGDWEDVPSAVVVARALERLDRRRKGILLLHDIQARTVRALPHLLRELKARGYKIVHAVPTAVGHAGPVDPSVGSARPAEEKPRPSFRLP